MAFIHLYGLSSFSIAAFEYPALIRFPVSESCGVWRTGTEVWGLALRCGVWELKRTLTSELIALFPFGRAQAIAFLRV